MSDPAIAIDSCAPCAGLAAVIAAKQSAFVQDAASAQATFRSSSSLSDGLRTVASVREHRVVVDEPESLGGTDTGPNPVELVLTALGTCQEITYKAYAAALGIPIERISATVSGHIDLRGFFGVADYAAARPGFSSVSVEVRIVSTATDDQLSALKAAVDAHCPVLDIVAQPVPVALTLVREQPSVSHAA